MKKCPGLHFPANLDNAKNQSASKSRHVRENVVISLPPRKSRIAPTAGISKDQMRGVRGWPSTSARVGVPTESRTSFDFNAKVYRYGLPHATTIESLDDGGYSRKGEMFFRRRTGGRMGGLLFVHYVWFCYGEYNRG